MVGLLLFQVVLVDILASLLTKRALNALKLIRT